MGCRDFKMLNYRIWLPIFTGLAAMACYIFCAAIWSPHPVTWTDPDTGILCWFFCSSLSSGSRAVVFEALILMAALASFTAAWGMVRDKTWARRLLIVSGLLLFPLGLLNLAALFPKRKTRYNTEDEK